MPSKRMPYTQAVCKAVQSADGPIPFADVALAVGAMPVRSSPRPERAIRSALRNSPLIAQTEDERYAYVLWLLKGATLRHVLTERDLSEGSLRLGTDTAYALFPFIYGSRHGDSRPCHLYLEEGPLFAQPLERLDGDAVGIQSSYALADWYDTARCHAGDSLLFEVTDGEEGIYHVFLQHPVPQDEARLADRNAALAQALERALARRRAPCYLWKVMPSLASQGAYHDPYPPLPLETIVQDTPAFRWADGKVSLVQQPQQEQPPEAAYLPGLSPGGQEPGQPARGFLQRLFGRKR